MATKWWLGGLLMSKCGVFAALVMLLHAVFCAIQRACAEAEPAPLRAPSARTAHAPFGATDREYLKAMQQPFTSSPPEVRRRGNAAIRSPDRRSSLAQIAAQCLAAVLLGTWGVMGLQGTFVPIRTTTHLAKQYAARPPAPPPR